MEILLLGIYSFFVWLIFIKFKWLPWNITTQVIAATIPIVGITALILFLNIFAPSSADVRVINYVVPINPARRGQGDRGAGRTEHSGQERRRAVPARPDAVRDPGAIGGGERRLAQGTADLGHRQPAQPVAAVERGPQPPGHCTHATRTRPSARERVCRSSCRPAPATGSTSTRHRRTRSGWRTT